MEVVADLGERMLRRFALKVAELVHATPLHGRPRPDLPDGPPQPGVTVDNSQHWRPQTARDEIVEAALPRFEGLASAQLEGEQLFAPVRKDPDDAQHRHADDLPATAEEGGPRQRERNWASRSRERPLPDAVAVAPSDFIALVRTRPKRGFQLLVHGRLDRDADMLVDQFAERDGLKLMRSDRLADTLRHAAFLR